MLAFRSDSCDNMRMNKKQQIYNRLAPEVVSRVVRDFNDGKISRRKACRLLEVSKAQLYRLRTKWLAGKKQEIELGVSGGNHVAKWPDEVVAALLGLMKSSGVHGPNFELYADELGREFGFVRSRSAVRRFCEKNFGKLMRKLFPIMNKKVPRERRWQRGSFGELIQIDSTPLHLWGPKDARQTIILALDDATRMIVACWICEHERLSEHFMVLEQLFTTWGVPRILYTDGFTMFGKMGEDIKSHYGRICRAFGIQHLIAKTPQAKGKIERSMRTFQHRIAIFLASKKVTNADEANRLVMEHCAYWNAHHKHAELGCTPCEAKDKLEAEGKNVFQPCPNSKVMNLFLALHERRRVELGTRIEFNGRKWKIAHTLKKSVSLLIRVYAHEFYVLEDRPDPCTRIIPKILGKFSF